MKFFPNSKTFLSVGSFSIQWYAVLILTGAILAYILCKRNTRKMKYPDEIIDDFFIDVLWIGIIGARIWYVLFSDLSYYLADPIRIFKIWEGGLAIHGGVIAGILYSLYFTKKRGISFYRLADAVLPNVLLAQAIGRWGNFVNQEAHGPMVDESFYNGILSFLKEGMCINGVYYEPTFFYESVLNIIGFLLIILVLKRFQNKRGDLAYAYLMWYGAVRIFIESLRTDALYIGPFKIAQLTSLVYIVIGVLGYLGIIDKLFHIKKRKPTMLFDLDGTLLDTEKGIHESYKYVFNKYGVEFTEEMEIEVLGPSLMYIFEKYIPSVDTNILVEEYRNHNKKIFSSVNKPMDNAGMILKTLKENGYHVGVVSTKMHDTVENNLKLYDLNQYVDDIIGREDVVMDKPNPEGINKILKKNCWLRDELIYVGDSYTDVEAGKNAGAYTVAYYFNPLKKDKLKAAGADEYIDDLKDILSIVEKPIHFTYNQK